MLGFILRDLFGLSGEIGFRDPASRQTSLHDHLLRLDTRDFELGEQAFELLRLAVLAFAPADEVVGGAAGEVLDRLDAVLTEGDHHLRGHTVDLAQLVGYAECFALLVHFSFQALQIFAGALLDFLGGFFVETVDGGDFVEFDISQLLDGGKAFGSQNLADHLVDIERVHEKVGALVEFLLTAFRFLGFRHDVDVPAGQLRSKANVLAAAANRQRQLFVRNHDFDALGVSDELRGIDGMTAQMMVALGEDGIKTMEDFAGCAADDLVGWSERKNGETKKFEGLFSKFDVSRVEAEQMVVQARLLAGWITEEDLAKEAEAVEADAAEQDA